MEAQRFYGTRIHSLPPNSIDFKALFLIGFILAFKKFITSLIARKIDRQYASLSIINGLHRKKKYRNTDQLLHKMNQLIFMPSKKKNEKVFHPGNSLCC